jgi:hypothetical protein
MLLFVIFSLPTVQASAQKFYVRDLFDFYNDVGGKDASRHRQLTYDDISGSPYVHDNFSEGTIISKNGNQYEKVPLRYNVYDDQIEFKHKDGLVLFISNPEDYTAIEIDGAKYVYLQLMDGKRKVQGYYVLLEDGEIQLLKKHAVVKKEAEPAKPYKDPVPAAFVPKPVAYFLLKDGKIFEISNDKNLLDACGNSEKLPAFIKENKLKVRKEEDLKKIVNFSNSL